MRRTLLLLAFLCVTPVWANDVPPSPDSTTQPSTESDAEKTAKPQRTPQAPAKRETADGVELPPASEKRLFGTDLYVPTIKDPIGRKPEEVFGFTKAIRTMEKSQKMAQAKLPAYEHDDLTMPYFVLDKWGAEYVGFSLVDGRIYQMQVRYQRNWHQNAWRPVHEESERLAKVRREKDSNSPTYYHVERGSVKDPYFLRMRLYLGVDQDRLLKKLLDQSPPSVKKAVDKNEVQVGWKIEEVMAGAKCISRMEGEDEEGAFVILSRVSRTDRRRGEPEVTPTLKVYVKDGKATRIMSIGSSDIKGAEPRPKPPKEGKKERGE